MSSQIRYITYLLSLVLFVYVMRQAELSPSGFLSKQITRMVQEQKISERFCGDGYEDLTFSTNQKMSADSYRAGFRNIRGDKTLSAFIARDEPVSTFAINYGKTFIPFLVPWAIFLLLAVFGCLTYSCNWCFMYVSFLKNRVWECCRRPKTPRFKNLFVILGSLFMLFSIGAGIAGIVLMSNYSKYTHATICSAVRFLEETQEGSEENKWVGVAPAITKLDKAVADIRKTVNDTSVYDTLLENYNKSLDEMMATLTSLYEKFKDRTLPRINPSGGVYQPFYVTELGPLDKEGSALNMIAKQLDDGRGILASNQADLDEFKTTAKQDTENTIQDVLSNRPILVETSDVLNETLTEIAEHQSTIDSVIKYSDRAMRGLYIANISVAGFAILAILLVCFGVRFFNKGVHLSWCTLGLLTIFGWSASLTLFATTIIVAETCDAASGALNDPVFFNQTFDKVAQAFNVNEKDSKDARRVLYRCVFGDGDLATEFDLTNNLLMFDTIFSKINQISAEANNSINILPAGGAAEARGLLDKFRTGYYPDSVDTVTDLVALNLVTNNKLNPCTSVDDQWVLNPVNCTAESGPMYQPDSPFDFNRGQSTCIPYDNWMAQPKDIALRYTPNEFRGFLCLSLNNRDTAIISINNLIRNRQATHALLDEMGKVVDVLDGQFASFVSDLGNTPKMLMKTNSSVNSIYMSLADKNVGLIGNTNCQYIVGAAWELHDVACAGAGIVIYHTTIVFLVMSFVGLLGTLFLFCLAKRFVVEKPYKKTDPRLYAKENIKDLKNKVTVD